MAIFTAGADGADMRYLFSWMSPALPWVGDRAVPIQTIVITPTQAAVGNLTSLSAAAIVTYTGSGFAESGLVPTLGTYTSAQINFGTLDLGTLSGFGSAGFPDIDGGGITPPYSLLAGNDTLNGSSTNDILFGGFSGIESFFGNGGISDAFVIGNRGSTGTHTFQGTVSTTDTIVVIANPDAPGGALDLTSSTITSIERIELEASTGVDIRSGQIGSSQFSDALVVTRITAGLNPTLTVRKDTAGTLDLSAFTLINVSLTLVGTNSGETLVGTSSAASSDFIIGGDGDDILDGGAGFNTLDGGAGSDTFRFGLGQTTEIADFKSRYFTATLSGANEVPPVATGATGSGFFTLNAAQSELQYLAFASSLSSNANGGHIHRGAAGVNGPVVFDLSPPASTFPFMSGFWSGVGPEVANLLAGNLYTNIHTTSFPTGEIRGQILAVAGDTGADRIDVSSLRIGSFATVQDLTTDVAGTATLTVIKNGVASSIATRNVIESLLASGDFIYSTNTANDLETGTAGIDHLFGAGGNDTLNGAGGDDRLYGEDGNDVLDGGIGNDTLNGGAGNDVLDGRAGADIMNGGAGNETYYWDNVADQIIELAGGGVDQIRSFISIDLGASAGLQQVERGYVYGQANATIFGNSLANVLAGNDGIGGVGGNNRLEGRGGADIINGGGGNDFIIGGTERDVMTGGTGRDGFRFYTIAEAGNGAGVRDIITDFTTSTETGSTLISDYIDLGLIDANLTNATHTFAFIGFNTAFTAAGQLRYRHEGGNTLIEGNVNADLGVDFQIQLNGLKTLVAGDFIL